METLPSTSSTNHPTRAQNFQHRQLQATYQPAPTSPAPLSALRSDSLTTRPTSRTHSVPLNSHLRNHVLRPRRPALQYALHHSAPPHLQHECKANAAQLQSSSRTQSPCSPKTAFLHRVRRPLSTTQARQTRLTHPVGLTTSAQDPGFGARDTGSAASKITNLVHSTRTVMRSRCPPENCVESVKEADEEAVPLILINTLIILYELVLGGS